MEREGGAIAFLELEFLVERFVSARAADPALGREDHRHRCLLDHRIHAEFNRRRGLSNGGAAAAEQGVFGVILAQIAEVSLQPGALARRAFQQLFQLVLLGQQVIPLTPQLHFLKLAQGAQPHVENRFGLAVSQEEFRHHHRLGLILGADDLDHPVKVEVGDDIAVEQFQPVGNLGQAVLAAADQDVDLALDPLLQDQLEAEHPGRAAGIEDVEVEPEPGFQIGQLEQRFLEQFRINVAALGDENQPNLLIRFIADVFQDRQLLVGDQLGNLLDQLALGELVGDFRNHQLPGTAAQLFDAGFFPRAIRIAPGRKAPAHAQRAAPGFISARDNLAAFGHDPAGGKVRPVEQLHQLGMFGMGIVDQQQGRIDDLGHVVAGDIGRHPHGDPAGAIGQQVREQAGEDLRLFLFPVVGRDEVDRAFVQPGHQLDRRLGQAGFGVAIGSGIIAIDVAEIALPIDQRVAQREVLGEADHRIVDRLVAVRVILADHVADHTGRLLVGIVGIELQLPHRPEQAAVNRLQPVTQVRQRARGNRGQGIDEIPLGQGRIERRVNDGVKGIRFGGVSRHCGSALAGRESCRQGLAALHVVAFPRNPHLQPVKRRRQGNLAGEPTGAGDAGGEVKHVFLVFARGGKLCEPVLADNHMTG